MVRRASWDLGDALRPHGVYRVPPPRPRRSFTPSTRGFRSRRNGWGTFIGIIAITKIAVALTGGKTTLAKTLGALYVLGNVWTIKVFLPMNDLMEAHGAGWPSIIHSKAP